MAVVGEDDYESAPSQALVNASVAELRARYGGREEPAAVVEGARFAIWVVAWEGHRAVGCGGLTVYSGDELELKRMYVVPAARGRGVSRLLLRELERLAVQRGYRAIRLETGTQQPEAIRLYRSAGYEPYRCWGPYADDPDSVCFRKELL